MMTQTSFTIYLIASNCNRSRPSLALLRANASRRPRSGLECDTRSLNECRINALKNGSIRTVPGNHSDGPLPEGCEPARLI